MSGRKQASDNRLFRDELNRLVDKSWDWLERQREANEMARKRFVEDDQFKSIAEQQKDFYRHAISDAIFNYSYSDFARTILEALAKRYGVLKQQATTEGDFLGRLKDLHDAQAEIHRTTIAAFSPLAEEIRRCLAKLEEDT